MTTMTRMTQIVYLDHNATSPVRAGVVDAVADALTVSGNASSVHQAGRQARQLVDQARDHVARLVGVSPAEIVFTSGGTEANNLVLRGVDVDHILVSTVEHPSVLEAADNIEQIPVDKNGLVDLAILEARLSELDGRILVSVMQANNETGVIEPIAEIVQIAKKYDALVHTDAIQALGKIAVERDALGVDFISLSSHKIGGPQGVGALVINEEVPLRALNRGGGQERNRRGGTENVPGIVGFGAAAEQAAEELSQAVEIEALRDQLEAAIKSIAPGTVIHGENVDRLPNTTCLSMPNVVSETQVMKFDLAGFMISAGAACSSGKVQASHVLLAMGVEDEEASTAIRISLGHTNNASDVEAFVEQWREMYARANRDALKGAA
ncbi:MAG: cysteine desulfurase [Rhodospirillaceae bacterium]|nr:cysteine desulfurase [Rhodospirillaceae bacterium]MBT4587855.1 cysteine desulfurase [Rhodospirillaceae bacterium]MBT4939261.1 cysteine desulfurase [Rhodospirillaceae bacterium]MBT5939211.1 cysteine desulfurase [Rhodospirillaceae bacterium]